MAGWAAASVWGGATTASLSLPPVNQERLAEWQAMRFGLFIHWGPVSLKGTEIGWSRGQQVPVEEYDQLYHRFNPTNFNAETWARIARDAGMKYVVFTTKHHDGFCEWDTKQTDYDIMHTPFGRDVVKELAAAVRKEGLMFGVYHSICDWYHPDYPLGSPGGKTKKPSPNMDRYNAYLKAQLKELLTGYGPVGVLWFDGSWEKPWTVERGLDLYRWVRGLQPDILVNNRVAGRHDAAGNPARSPFHGDFDTPEQRIGTYQDSRPWETCMTICRQWAWKPNDQLKSLSECVLTLVRCAGGDGNLLFNVGPRPDGTIEPRQVARLREIGAWLRQNGESIYGTRGGPWKPTRRIASTRRGNVIYLHLMQLPEDTDAVTLPALPRGIVRATRLGGGPVTVTVKGDQWQVRVPAAERDPMDTIVKLELDGTAMTLTAVALPRLMDFAETAASNVYQQQKQFGPDAAFDENAGSRWATDGGVHQAWISAVLKQPRTLTGVRIQEAAPYFRVRRFEFQYRAGPDQPWRTLFTGKRLGGHFHRTFPPVTAQAVRLNILEATDGPTISEIELMGK